MIPTLALALGVGAAGGLGLAGRLVRRRGLDRWLIPYLLQSARRRRPVGEVHLLLCIADHYEPQWGGARPELAWARVERWCEAYPRLFGDFRDADGRPPQHTFFFPLEEYEPE